MTEEIKEDVPEVHLTELQEEPKLEELSNEELGRVIAARWTGEDTTVHVPEERNPADETIENQDNESDIDSDLEPEHDYSEDDEYASYREEEEVPETCRVCQLNELSFQFCRLHVYNAFVSNCS